VLHWCEGPYEALIVDLIHLDMITSQVVASMLQLLERYRTDSLSTLTLINVSDRVIRLLEMMNLRKLFVIRQHGIT
jgi:anti-anti-sigma regulatory factor